MAHVGTTLTRPSKLLQLPRGLRDVIYFYAVAKAYDITLDRHNCLQPPLLRTCHQIREEASAVFYKENYFRVELLNCKFEPQPDHWYWTAPFDKDVTDRGLCVWSNLKEWMRLDHECRVQHLDLDFEETDEDDWSTVMHKAWDVVGQMKAAGVGWDVTERILDMYKAGVEANTIGGKFE